jgi:hypothetical protein
MHLLPRNLLLLAQISRHRTTRKRHKNRGADLYICAGNSGMNFEEFGSDFV